MEEKNIPTTVEAYIASFPAPVQERMKAIRETILRTTPGIQEKISWDMPTFFRDKRRMHFAAHKAHIGLYPGPAAILLFPEELQGFTTTKGGIQLPYTKPLPLELVGKIAGVVFNG